MSEQFVMRLKGGPTPGTHTTEAGWPLPDRVMLPVAPSGYYRKVTESQLPEQDEASPLIRGAEYEWVQEVH